MVRVFVIALQALGFSASGGVIVLQQALGFSVLGLPRFHTVVSIKFLFMHGV